MEEPDVEQLLLSPTAPIGGPQSVPLHNYLSSLEDGQAALLLHVVDLKRGEVRLLSNARFSELFVAPEEIVHRMSSQRILLWFIYSRSVYGPGPA
jgi:hypothetical protein